MTKKDNKEGSDNAGTLDKKNNTVVKNASNKPITAKVGSSEPKVQLIDDSEEPYKLTNDDGQEEEFVGIAAIEYQSQFYIIMKPTNPLEDMEDDEALLFRIEPEDDDTDMYLPVEDEELADRVFAEYLRHVDELLSNDSIS